MRQTKSPANPIWRTLGIALLVVIGVVGGRYWYLQTRANWGVVIPGQIYRSAQLSRFLIRAKLKDNNIRVIVCLSRAPDSDPDGAAERQVADDLKIRVVDWPMNGDGLSDPAFYPAVLAEVYRDNQQGQAVLIHCHAGAQRTSGVVATYRVLVQGWPAQQAYEEMRQYGFDPAKNTKLLPFMNEHMSAWTDELVRLGIIARGPTPVPQLHP